MISLSRSRALGPYETVREGVLRRLRAGPPDTGAAIASALSLPRFLVFGVLRELEKRGVVSIVDGRWMAKET